MLTEVAEACSPAAPLAVRAPGGLTWDEGTSQDASRSGGWEGTVRRRQRHSRVWEPGGGRLPRTEWAEAPGGHRGRPVPPGAGQGGQRCRPRRGAERPGPSPGPRSVWGERCQPAAARARTAPAKSPVLGSSRRRDRCVPLVQTGGRRRGRRRVSRPRAPPARGGLSLPPVQRVRHREGKAALTHWKGGFSRPVRVAWPWAQSLLAGGEEVDFVSQQ